ncbi:MAG: serine hydrolase [Aliifodinibius sp.]|nr:beta-lactamase family protein [Fodinibius sp.]NIV16323.1 serine hydrolase [Fodinibius sp.]NIY30290.1 serine hydrolase [Fodinibius sp.]
MYRKTLFTLSAIYLVFALLLPGCKSDKTPTAPEFYSLEEEIDNIANRCMKVGAMIGVINKQQEKLVFSYGTKSRNSTEPPDANTVFEIGSITKTFTATLAADMFLKGHFADDTVGHYLPAGQVTMPTRDGVETRLIHLLTHSSGIPRSPRGTNYPFPPGYVERNPYAEYTTEHIYDYLTNYCVLEFTPGTWWSYSNTGMGLLGHIVGLVDGSTYETVLTREIFDELGMDNSSLFLTDQQRSNLAIGHDINRQIMPNWDAQDIFQGAGFIKTSLNDMFKYLEAQLGLIETPLRDAMDFTHQAQFHQGSLGDMGLAWYILELDDGQVVIYHGGGTGGYNAYLGFNKSLSTGAIVLFNSKMQDIHAVGELVMKAIHKYDS